MKRPEILAFLSDISRACALVQRFTARKTLADYVADPMLRSAVERQFEIIGEALRRAIALDPSLGERISDAARIIAFRNRLIHGYATVSDEVVWGVLEGSLERLEREVRSLLGDTGKPA